MPPAPRASVGLGCGPELVWLDAARRARVARRASVGLGPELVWLERASGSSGSPGSLGSKVPPAAPQELNEVQEFITPAEYEQKKQEILAAI